MQDLLVLSGGHPYDEPAFAELLGSLDGWRVTHLLHPEAERLVGEGRAAEADGLLFYDMPGYTFADGKVETRPPSEAFRRAIMDRFAAGKGAVALHHAIAGWAEWPEWAELIGGRFLYQPGKVRGQEKPDSGYRHEVAYTAEVVLDHPVTAGLPKTFPVTDEVYLAEVFADSIQPLVRARHAFVRENFYSAAAAVAGHMFDNAGWDHAPGNDCVAWVKPAGAANLVYLQFGDAPETYANPAVRQILANALRFTAAS
ncbi:ThuA domain-containing protein [Novosphingobium ginsenosidimutans]|uniref:ThuA domain-containing protein n=1 Tax=Novosphingobium ginsenosidimutans TaxID=1176536 RepID=A0A5B8S3Q2_9SPHN|nr:ThuA domain-containing protein [Novosphingobium ginsenosidimutans]QEA16166.1 ThuA domain-containing protein [Novosphingobium ginsenosidimutans]